MNTAALLSAFDDPKSMEAMRKDFQENFAKLWKEREREYCAKHGIDPVMTDQMASEIMRYLARCNTPFHIEALRQMVLRDFQVPDDYNDLDRMANNLMTQALKG